MLPTILLNFVEGKFKFCRSNYLNLQKSLPFQLITRCEEYKIAESYIPKFYKKNSTKKILIYDVGEDEHYTKSLRHVLFDKVHTCGQVTPSFISRVKRVRRILRVVLKYLC